MCTAQDVRRNVHSTVLTTAPNGNISSGYRPWVTDKSGIFIKCGILNVGHISVEAIKWLLITSYFHFMVSHDKYICVLFYICVMLQLKSFKINACNSLLVCNIFSTCTECF